MSHTFIFVWIVIRRLDIVEVSVRIRDVVLYQGFRGSALVAAGSGAMGCAALWLRLGMADILDWKCLLREVMQDNWLCLRSLGHGVASSLVTARQAIPKLVMYG